MSMYTAKPTPLIEAVAEKLKKVDAIMAPEWSVFAKTGVHRERPPINPHWWHIRAAAMMRKIRILGPIGTSKLRRKFGGKKNNTRKGREHMHSGSGSVARKILQQLEKAGLAVQTVKGVHKGRILTPKGISLLDKTAEELKTKS